MSTCNLFGVRPKRTACHSTILINGWADFTEELLTVGDRLNHLHLSRCDKWVWFQGNKGVQNQ